MTWHKKLLPRPALMHQVTSVPKQQVISHHCYTSRSSSFSSWGFRMIESHWEATLSQLLLLKATVKLCVGVGGTCSFTLVTGIISSAQWSSIHLQEQGLLWHCMKQHSTVKSVVSRLQYQYLTACLLIRWTAQYTPLHNIMKTSICLFVPDVICSECQTNQSEHLNQHLYHSSFVDLVSLTVVLEKSLITKTAFLTR